MNKISTGAFQIEMDASNKQQTLAEKFVAIWEKKNAKAARAGGLSLMALSLAACGSSDDSTTSSTTTDTTTTTSTTDAAQQKGLTSNTDILTTGSGDDSINGSSATFQSDDVLDGGAGTDTLSVSAAAAGSVIANISNIETVKVTNGGAANTDYALNMIGATGVSEVMSRLSTGEVSFDNIQNAVTVTAFGTQANSLTTAGFLNSLATGTADSVSLKIDGGGNTTFQVSGTTDTNEFETVNLESAGASKNTVAGLKDAGTNDTASTKTVNITGTADLDITLAGGAAKAAVSASAATGDVKMVWGGNFTTLTGGSGADTFDLSAGSFLGATATKTVTGGTGSDTIVFAENVQALTSSVATAPHAVTGVETLEIEAKLADGGVADLARVVEADLIAGITSLKIDASNLDGTAGGGSGEDVTVTINDIESQSVDIKFLATGTATNDETVSLNLKDDTGAADVMNISISNPVAATSVTGLTTLTVGRAANAANNLVETVNLTLNATDVATVDGTTIGTLDATYTETLNILGTGDATIGAIEVRDPAGTGTATIDAGAMTGNLTLSTLFKATAADTIALTLGSGTNSVDFSTEALSADSVTATAGSKDTVKIKEGATDLEMTISGVEDLEITGAGATKVISAKKFTNVETIEVYDAAAQDNGSDNVKLTNIAAGQAIEMHSTNATKADWKGDTLTLDGATGVDALAVTIKGGVALEATNIISVDSSALTITDSNVVAATGFSLDQTLNVVGTTIANQTVDVGTLTLAGGGLSAAATNAVLTVAGTANVDIDTLDASGLASDLVITGLDTGAAAAITMGDTSNKITIALADAARDAIDIDGGAGTDTIVVADLAGGTYRPGATNVEKIDVDTEDAAGTTAAITLHLGDATSITEVQVDFDLADENFTVAGASSVTKHVLMGDTAATTDIVTLGSAATTAVTNEAALGANFATALVTPDATNITFKQGHSSAQAYTSVTAAKATDITVGGTDADTAGTQYAGAITMATLSGAKATTLNVDSNQGDRTINTLTAAKLTAITVVGDNATNLGTTAATTTLLASIDGSTSTGAITIGAGMDFTTSADIKTGTAADVINIDILNEANVTIDAGEKATTDVNDTVNFAGANNQGLTVVDLSSTTDQVSQVNGAVNGAAQINIESVDFSGMTGSFGVSVTGSAEANTVTGTANADTIVAGSKGLTVNSGKGADTIQFGAGEDTITFSDATGSKVAEMDNGFFTITNFTGGTDNLIFSENDYSDLSGAGAAGAIDSKTVGLLANTSTAMNTANAQLDGSGAVDVSANDAIFFVGTNSAGNTLDVYFVEDDNVVKTATIATAVAAADAVKIGTISIVGSALVSTDITTIA